MKFLLTQVINSPELRSVVNSRLVDGNLFIKLFYPDKPEVMRTDLISWEGFINELNEDTTTPTTYWGRLSRAKLLLADEIQYTDQGIIAVNYPPQFTNTTPEIPERRKF